MREGRKERRIEQPKEQTMGDHHKVAHDLTVDLVGSGVNHVLVVSSVFENMCSFSNQP
jgi:hypothetical protein